MEFIIREQASKSEIFKDKGNMQAPNTRLTKSFLFLFILFPAQDFHSHSFTSQNTLLELAVKARKHKILLTIESVFERSISF